MQFVVKNIEIKVVMAVTETKIGGQIIMESTNNSRNSVIDLIWI